MRSRPTSDRDGCLHGGLNEREAAPVRASAQRHLRTKSGRNQAPQYVNLYSTVGSPRGLAGLRGEIVARPCVRTSPEFFEWAPGRSPARRRQVVAWTRRRTFQLLHSTQDGAPSPRRGVRTTCLRLRHESDDVGGSERSGAKEDGRCRPTSSRFHCTLLYGELRA